MKKLKQDFLFVILVILSFLTISFVTPLQADSYWKVISWQTGTGNNDTADYAILIPHDCKKTPINWEWVDPDCVIDLQGGVDSPEPVHLLMRKTDQHLNDPSDYDAFFYEGVDGNNRPIIHFSYIVGEADAFIQHTPTPPCFNITLSNWTLNGSAYDLITVPHPNSALIMDARNTSSSDNKYKISIQLANSSGQPQGNTVGEAWRKNGSTFNKESYNLQDFCSANDVNFQLQAGNFYRITLTVNPTHSTHKLLYIASSGGGGSTPRPLPHLEISRKPGVVKINKNQTDKKNKDVKPKKDKKKKSNNGGNDH